MKTIYISGFALLLFIILLGVSFLAKWPIGLNIAFAGAAIVAWSAVMAESGHPGF